jgi:hypothetical protein
VHEPGSYRSLVFALDHSYVARYWGTLDEQIAEATAENLKAHSGLEHKPMNLWTRNEDCGHPNPDEDEKYDGVDDLLDEWWKRNFPASLTYKDGDLYYRNRRRGYGVVPEYAAWRKALADWQAVHDGGVCLDQYQGTCCIGCDNGDDDFGHEAGECYRSYRAREAQADFWWLFSPENNERERAWT